MPDRASHMVTFKAIGVDIDNVSVAIGNGGVRITDGFGGWEVVPRARKTAMTQWRGYQPLTLEIPVIFYTYSRQFDDGKRIEADCINLGMMAGRGEPSPEPQIKSSKVVRYTVHKGDTYAKIAHAKKVDLPDLLQLNNIRDPAKIHRGDSLILPASSANVPFGQPPIIELIADGNLIPYNDLMWDDEGLDRKNWVISEIAWEDAYRNIYGDRTRQHATVTVLQHVAPVLVSTKTVSWRRTKKKTRKTKKK